MEIKQRAQRGMTFLIRTFIFTMAATKQHFYGEKKGSNFCQKNEIFFGLSIVVQPNQGVQLKDRLL